MRPYKKNQLLNELTKIENELFEIFLQYFYHITKIYKIETKLSELYQTHQKLRSVEI